MKKSVLLAVSLSFCATPALADYTYYNQDNMQPRQYHAYNGNGGYSDNLYRCVRCWVWTMLFQK